MDRFAAFHSGVSSKSMQKWELEILGKVDRVQAASTSLLSEVERICGDASLCLNGFDAEAVSAALAEPAPTGPAALGYVGTIGAWFDWNWVERLAEQLDAEGSSLPIRLIGPCFQRPSGALPQRISMEPALPHAMALRAMRALKVGLIPFKVNALTEGVDPIMYYESRALGLPVVGTSFGELSHKTSDAGLFLADATDPLASVRAALALSEGKTRVSRPDCTWSARFAPLVDWVRSRQSA
jgi:hypothetical protein